MFEKTHDMLSYLFVMSPHTVKFKQVLQDGLDKGFSFFPPSSPIFPSDIADSERLGIFSNEAAAQSCTIVPPTCSYKRNSDSN